MTKPKLHLAKPKNKPELKAPSRKMIAKLNGQPISEDRGKQIENFLLPFLKMTPNKLAEDVKAALKADEEILEKRKANPQSSTECRSGYRHAT